MKKIIISLIACMMVLAAVTITWFFVKKDTPTDNKYEIYKLAASSGYSGTYEEWLESISGREVQLRVTNNAIEWKYDDDTEWKELCKLEKLMGEKGNNGSEIELNVNSGYIKWKYSDEENWKNLIAINDLVGAKGDQVEFNLTNEYLQWKYSDEVEWLNLIEISTLIGEKGDKGDAGSEVELTVDSGYIKWKYHDEEKWKNLIDIKTLVGEKGDKGEDGKKIEFNVSNTHIEWRYENENTWKKLIDLTLIKGEKGDKGDDGKTIEFRINESWVQWKYIVDDEWTNLYEINGNIAPSGLAHVKFVLNGGSMEGYQAEMDITQGYTIDLPTPEKSGYTFLGWFEDLDDEYAVPKKYRVHESINLYAKWEAGAKITGTKIYNLNDLTKIKKNLSGTYVLMNNIDCDGLALPIIGENENSKFSGIFDGQGYTISNFTIANNSYAGLFGYSTGIIRNLNIEKFKYNISGSSGYNFIYTGGLVGYNEGIISNCTVVEGDIDVVVDAKRYSGLIAGVNIGTIQNCLARGDVSTTQISSSNNKSCMSGGICGQNKGKIYNCLINANTYAYGIEENIGPDTYYGHSGIVCGYAENGSVIKNCIVMGSSDGKRSSGDVAGVCDGTINNCYKDEYLVVNNNTNSVATVLNVGNLSNINFFTTTLGWSQDEWDLTDVLIHAGWYPIPIQKEEFHLN